MKRSSSGSVCCIFTSSARWARDEARDESDVDLFFDYEKGKLGLFELMDVKEAAARILGRRTDIMTRDSIHKLLRQRIEATAVIGRDNGWLNAVSKSYPRP